MHPLHDYIASELSERLKSRRVVVWYDPPGDYAGFIAELRPTPLIPSSPVPISLEGMTVQVAEYAGSFFELRTSVEALVSPDAPDPLLLYVPGVLRDHKGSVLMELETAGICFDVEIKHLARQYLRRRFTEGVIDDLLTPNGVTYADIARIAADASRDDTPSILKAIFHEASGSEAILATWLAQETRDAELEAKSATPELVKLISATLGLEPEAGVALSKLRAVTTRYILGNDLRAALRGAAPPTLDGIPAPPTPACGEAVRVVADRLRTAHAEAYVALADQVEGQLRLREANIPPDSLAAIHTFRFLERLVWETCGRLVATGQFEEARTLLHDRGESFWLDRDVTRKAQWEACRLMAELGQKAATIRATLSQPPASVGAWLAAYTDPEGWYQLDRAHRRLEAWVATLQEEPEEQPLGIVRRAYEDACNDMAEGFTRALAQAQWTLPEAFHQARAAAGALAARPRPVAYFLVDAFRYEMGLELIERLPKDAEVAARHALCMIPSITEVGMAALLPDASASFNVVERNGTLGAQIADAFLPDLVARRKFLKARIPGLVDVTLDELLGMPSSRLAKKIEGAQVIVVRSQEIDRAGEAGFAVQARQAIDTVIDNLARALRKLANAGVEHAVVAADHGHLFFPEDRDESMRIEAPGGETVALHRRCWIGRGGATPAGCVRVAAATLGYASDLEFVFPVGIGVFRAGGDLAYHHGGLSLQELVVPVIEIRLPAGRPAKRPESPVEAVGLPEAVTNRIFSLVLQVRAEALTLFGGPLVVRPLLVSGGRQVGGVGMAIGAEHDPASGCVTLQPHQPATVAFLLSDDRVPALRMIVQDPTTDAELYRSPADIPVRLGVV